MSWKRITEVDQVQGRMLLARDADGNERWTHFNDGAWCYESWEEGEWRYEYMLTKTWSPIEFKYRGWEWKKAI